MREDFSGRSCHHMQIQSTKEFAIAEIMEHESHAVLYTSTSDSRWHESSHGTAFKTD